MDTAAFQKIHEASTEDLTKLILGWVYHNCPSNALHPEAFHAICALAMRPGVVPRGDFSVVILTQSQ